jgi:hypothetical protein
MPNSDEFFHQGRAIPPPMFQFGKEKALRGGMTDGEPTADEMAKQFDALLHDKHVNLKKVCVETFDLRQQEEKDKYCELYVELYAKVQSRLALVRGVDKRFVEGANPTWLVCLEWWEYALEVDGEEVTPEEYDKITKRDSALNDEEAEQGDKDGSENGSG